MGPKATVLAGHGVLQLGWGKARQGVTEKSIGRRKMCFTV